MRLRKNIKKWLCFLLSFAVLGASNLDMGTVYGEEDRYDENSDFENFENEIQDAESSEANSLDVLESDITITSYHTTLQEMSSEYDIWGVIFLVDQYEVKEAPTKDSKTILQVTSGQTVSILDYSIDEACVLWLYVKIDLIDSSYLGYVEREYIATSDERYLEWEKQIKEKETILSEDQSRVTGEDTINNVALFHSQTGDLQEANEIGNEMLESDGNEEPSQEFDQYETYYTEKYYASNNTLSEDVARFPESYQPYLQALKNSHPNWIFVRMDTGYDWNTVLAAEMKKNVSLTSSSAVYMRSGPRDSTGWGPASKEAVEYYLDPRNGLNETYIFEFEQLTYNSTYQTESAVQAFLNSTFMKGNMPGTDQTYANAFYMIGGEMKVSPTHLASRVYQEQGQGTSPLISGTYSGYEGYYNYFNVNANGTTKEQVYVSGLSYAKSMGWNTRYKSLQGGARLLASKYIGCGQDTLYLEKYNVSGNSYGLGSHQYMQNIAAPMSEGSSTRKIYTNAGVLNNIFVFKVPVYTNMPSLPCQKPTAYGMEITIPNDYTSDTIYVDGVAYNANRKKSTLIAYLSGNTSKKAILYKYEDGIPIECYEYTLTYDSVNCKYNVSEGVKVVLEAPWTEAKVVGYNMSLDGTYHLNWYLRFSKENEANASTKVQIQVGEELYEYEKGEPLDSGCHMYAVTVPPCMIDEVMTVKVLVDNACKKEFSYSVREYLNTIIQQSSYSTTEKQLAGTMVEYGEYAKTYFRYVDKNAVSIENQKVTYTNWVADGNKKCTFDNSIKSSQTMNQDFLFFYGASLNCENTITLKLYYKPLAEETVSNLMNEIAVDVSGKKKYELYETNNMICISIPNISANELNKFFDISITRGNQFVTISYSPYVYLKKAVSLADNMQLKNVSRALYFFSETSRNYINSLNEKTTDSYSLTQAAYEKALLNVTQYPVDWKKALFFGDSITMGVQAGVAQDPWPVTYPEVIGKRLNISIENKADGGAEIWTGQSDNPYLYDQVNMTGVRNDVDAVFFMAGVFDWFYGTKMKLEDSCTPGSFAYDVNQVFALMKQNYQNASIFIVLPPEPYEHLGAESYYDLEELRKIQKRIAEEYGFYVIDLNAQNLFNGTDAQVKAFYLSNSVFPSSRGYEVLGTLIAGEVVRSVK